MAKKQEYLENINTREFYEFYKKHRRKPSKKIDQYNYFKKAINGLLMEVRRCLDGTEHGVHLKGLGVLYKRPFGEFYKKLTMFTHKLVERGRYYFYLEDDYLRHKYIITNLPKISNNSNIADKPEAIILHRKTVRKWK